MLDDRAGTRRTTRTTGLGGVPDDRGGAWGAGRPLGYPQGCPQGVADDPDDLDDVGRTTAQVRGPDEPDDLEPGRRGGCP